MEKTGFMKRRVEDKVEPEESYVAPGTKFVGNIVGPEGIRVSGHLKGNIRSEGLVWIQKEGKVEGNIKSRFAIIEGKLKGHIDSSEHVEIRADGHVVGNIQTDRIAVAEGSFFQGEIQMPGKEDEPIRFVEKRQDQSKMDSSD